MGGTDSPPFRQCPGYDAIEGIRVEAARTMLAGSSTGSDASGPSDAEEALQFVYGFVECRAYNYHTALQAWDEFQRQHGAKVSLWQTIYDLLKRAQSGVWTDSVDGPLDVSGETLLVAAYAAELGVDWYECAARSSPTFDLTGDDPYDSSYWRDLDPENADDEKEIRRVPFLQGVLRQAVLQSNRTDTADEPWKHLPSDVVLGRDADPADNPFLRFGSQIEEKRETIEDTARGLVRALERDEVKAAFAELVDGTHRSAQLQTIRSLLRQLWSSSVGREFLKKQWMYSFDDSEPDPTFDPLVYVDSPPADVDEANLLADVLAELLPGLAYWYATAEDESDPIDMAGKFFDRLLGAYGLDAEMDDYATLGEHLDPDSGGGTDLEGIRGLGTSIISGVDSAIESALGRGSGSVKSVLLLFRVVGVVTAAIDEREASERSGPEALVTFAKFSNDVANVANHYIDEASSKSAKLAVTKVQRVLGPVLAVVDIALTLPVVGEEIDTGDYDAAAGAGLMTVGGLTSLVGPLFFVGLASASLIGLGIVLTVAGSFLLTFRQDRPTVEWVKNCAFGWAWSESPSSYQDPEALDFRYRYELPGVTRTNHARQVQHLQTLSRARDDGSTGFVRLDETSPESGEGAAIELTFAEDVLYDLRIEPFAVAILKPIIHLGDIGGRLPQLDHSEYAVGMWDTLVMAGNESLLPRVPWEYTNAVCLAEGTSRESTDLSPSDLPTALPGFIARLGAASHWTSLMGGVTYDRWDYHSAMRSVHPSASLELSSPGFYWQSWKGRLATNADASSARLAGLVVPGSYDVKAAYVEVDLLSKTQYEQYKLLDARIGGLVGSGRTERAKDLAATRRTMPVLARDRVENPLY